jgi:hypothetical protein
MRISKNQPGLEAQYTATDVTEEVAAWLGTQEAAYLQEDGSWIVSSRVAATLTGETHPNGNPKLPSTSTPADPKAQLKYPGLPSGRTASVLGHGGDS